MLQKDLIQQKCNRPPKHKSILCVDSAADSGFNCTPSQWLYMANSSTMVHFGLENIRNSFKVLKKCFISFQSDTTK